MRSPLVRFPQRTPTDVYPTQGHWADIWGKIGGLICFFAHNVFVIWCDMGGLNQRQALHLLLHFERDPRRLRRILAITHRRCPVFVCMGRVWGSCGVRPVAWARSQWGNALPATPDTADSSSRIVHNIPTHNTHNSSYHTNTALARTPSSRARYSVLQHPFLSSVSHSRCAFVSVFIYVAHLVTRASLTAWRSNRHAAPADAPIWRD